MRVLVYTESHWLGGADKFLGDLLPRLDRGRFEATVASNPNEEFAEWLAQRAPGVPHHAVGVTTEGDSRVLAAARAVRNAAGGSPGPAPGPSSTDSVSDRPARTMAAAVLRWQRLASNVARLRGLLRQSRPDVLHINNGGYPGGESCRALALAARAERVPRTVFFAHAYPLPRAWPAWAERRLDAAVDRGVSEWVAPAKGAAAALHRTRGIDPERIRTIYLGERARGTGGRDDARGRLGIDPGRAVLSVVGSLEERKGQDVALEAVAALRARGTDPLLLVVGTGDRHPRLERAARDLELDGSVRFLGWREDVDDVMAASDVLLHPSTHTELLPYSIKEAMAHGRPVVASNVGGVPELVENGSTGLLVAPGEAGALADATHSLLDDPGRADALGRAGLRRLEEHFGLERMVEAVTAAYLGEPG